MTERTLERGSMEYKKLTAVANLLELFSPNHARYVVEDVYLDFGQDWMWTTIVRKDFRECQILSPRQWQDIMLANSPQAIVNRVEDIRNDKYFMDKEGY